MRLVHSAEVPAQSVAEEGARSTTVRWLISRQDGAPSFAMRLFELAPGGCTPRHEHPWEHEVFVLDGPLEIVQEAGETELTAGDAVLVLPGERHQFRSRGEAPARMLCIIPLRD